jgi:hypothetical protein
MNTKPESRRKIEGDGDQRKRGIAERAKHMGLVVEEKKRIAKASKELRLSTTSEGAQAVKKAMKDAAKATDTEFKGQDRDITTKFEVCKKAEDDLRARTQAAKEDASKARAVAGQVKETNEAKTRMAAAEKAATDDAKYTESQKRKQEKNRSESTKRRDQQRSQLNSTKLAW